MYNFINNLNSLETATDYPPNNILIKLKGIPRQIEIDSGSFILLLTGKVPMLN